MYIFNVSFQPCTPTYYISREQMFENWPKQLIPKPSNLIKNGFYYTNVGDRVTCFCCGVTIKQWNESDIIENEHSKWEPNCLFAKMVSNKQLGSIIAPAYPF